MIFAAKGASDGIYVAFDKDDKDTISLAQIHRNRGLKKHRKEEEKKEEDEDGRRSYSVLIDVVASTSEESSEKKNGFASTMCFTFVMEDEMICALGKANPAGSFDDCPPVPVVADFMAEDGAGLDLDALDAEVAQKFRRPAAGDDLATSPDAQWPADLAGLWKGEEYYAPTAAEDEDKEGVLTKGPIYTLVTEGYTPNPWVVLDAENPSKIASANIGKFAGAERLSNDVDVYRNDVFKYMPGTDVEARAGREKWCNSYLVDGDKMFMFSNSAVEGSEEAPECPKAPDPEWLSSDDAVVIDAELLKSNGASAAGIFSRE